MVETSDQDLIIPKPPTIPPQQTLSKPFNFIIPILIVLLLISVTTTGFIYYKYSNTTLQLELVNSEFADVKSRLALIEPQKTITQVKEYCAKGEIYNNAQQQYKICYPKGWHAQALTDLKDKVAFSITPTATSNGIVINTSKDDMENALNRLASDVYVDSTDRQFVINDIKGIQVVGTVESSSKKAITVFTRKGKTYEIVLSSPADATFTDYLQIYKDIVNTFTFVD